MQVCVILYIGLFGIFLTWTNTFYAEVGAGTDEPMYMLIRQRCAALVLTVTRNSDDTCSDHLLSQMQVHCDFPNTNLG